LEKASAKAGLPIYQLQKVSGLLNGGLVFPITRLLKYQMHSMVIEGMEKMLEKK
jgi:hypothetical protein